PYIVAPGDSKLDGLRHDFPQASKINHPELRAVDPPGAELLFKFLSSITDRPLFYKIIFAIADLAVAALLLRLIGGENRYRDAAWYAWNPPSVNTSAGAPHFDSVWTLAWLGEFLALVGSTIKRDRQTKWLLAV